MRRLAWLVIAGCVAPEGSAVQSITNGSADAGDPAVVALVDPTGRAGCTATVIEAHTAITAAHCVTGFDPRILRVWFGGGDYSAVSGARTHPMFDPTSLANDVAVVTFRDPAQVAPLALETAAPAVGTVIRAVGYGTTAAGSDDGGEKRAGSAMISDVQATELTALPQPSQPCHGDSGGPALLPAGTIGGVVSRGDAACSDHTIYARVDVAQSFVTGYLAETAPGTASVGQPCLYDGQCAGGPCLVTADDPELAFCAAACTHDSDCPAAMTCKDSECRYPVPSPGAIGSTCSADADCTSGTCLRGACTRSCGGSATCPSGFSCSDDFCTADTSGCGGCNGGGSPALVIALAVLFAAVRRSGRRA
jgi:hypothetical protein